MAGMNVLWVYVISMWVCVTFWLWRAVFVDWLHLWILWVGAWEVPCGSFRCLLHSLVPQGTETLDKQRKSSAQIPWYHCKDRIQYNLPDKCFHYHKSSPKKEQACISFITNKQWHENSNRLDIIEEWSSHPFCIRSILSANFSLSCEWTVSSMRMGWSTRQIDSRMYICSFCLLICTNSVNTEVKVKVQVLSLDPKLALTTSQFCLTGHWK